MPKQLPQFVVYLGIALLVVLVGLFGINAYLLSQQKNALIQPSQVTPSSAVTTIVNPTSTPTNN